MQFHRIYADMQQIYKGFMKTTRTSHSFKRTIIELPIFPQSSHNQQGPCNSTTPMITVVRIYYIIFRHAVICKFWPTVMCITTYNLQRFMMLTYSLMKMSGCYLTRSIVSIQASQYKFLLSILIIGPQREHLGTSWFWSGINRDCI